MKTGVDMFHVSIGANDGAEVCEVMIQKTFTYIEKMNCQFLRPAVVHKWKEMRNTYKKHLRTLVYTLL